MKRKTIIMTALAILCCGILLTRSGEDHTAAIAVESVQQYTVLVAGLDAVGNHTDVLFLARYLPEEKKVHILQIPRDTYCRFGYAQNKINQVYAHALAQSRYTRKTALQYLAHTIEEKFGIAVDYSLLLTEKSVVAVVDALGGVPVALEKPLAYEDPAQNLRIALPEGEHLLSGEEAMMFLRYRSGYAKGDLDRLDAQKKFLAALLRKLSSDVPLPRLPALLVSAGKGSVTDIPLPQALRLATSFWEDHDDITVTMMTLPGEAARLYGDRGLWYYQCNRAACETMLNTYFPGGQGTFDSKEELLPENNTLFYNIYYDKNHRFTVHEFSCAGDEG